MGDRYDRIAGEVVQAHGIRPPAAGPTRADPPPPPGPGERWTVDHLAAFDDRRVRIMCAEAYNLVRERDAQLERIRRNRRADLVGFLVAAWAATGWVLVAVLALLGVLPS